MLILIPLGGLGIRFKSIGYSLPKPLINVMGNPIICWVLDRLSIKSEDKIIIPYNNELKKYRFEEMLIKRYPKIEFIFLQLAKNTEGASETVKIALEYIQYNYPHIDDQPIICLDGDNFYTCDILDKWNRKNQVFTFKDTSNEPIYSYIKLQENCLIDIKEKEKISHYACTGSYGFESWNILLAYCTHIIKENIRQKNEFYISTVIMEMIKNKIIFTNNEISISDYICLGTPLQVRIFCNNFPRINALNNMQMFKKQRYCFDLDNTLVTYPKVNGDYTTVEPLHKNIKFIRYLKRLGHDIIIYTARNMKTNEGNLGKTTAKIGKITLDTLERFDIPYDEIYFGKPYADYYIDDLAISCYEDLEKSLGFYESYIEPRSFNNLDASSIQLYRKSSDNSLIGEIYYYNNIPLSIKDMFPVLFAYDTENFKWYDMEKINGVSITHLFLSGDLTPALLENIIKSLHRIHLSNDIDKLDKVNIYYNYTIKLKERFNNYDYSLFPNVESIYKQILCKLTKYEEDNKGKLGIIHGDSVFTNILINQFGKIKFIDMRGKQGEQTSIYGDIFYDYGKLLQSLIGYDEILQDKYVNINYKKELIDTFIKIFCSLYDIHQLEYVKWICKSLLLSLIPLHHNQKCKNYFELISSDILNYIYN